LWALYEANELEPAQQVFRQYQDVIAASALPDFLVVAFLAAARTEAALGDGARADEILDQLEGICYRHAWTRLTGLVNWERVRRALTAGHMEDAQVIAAHCSSRDSSARARHWLAFADDFEGARLVRIRLAIHNGDFEVAAARLKTQLKRKSVTLFHQIKLHQLNALLQHKRRARDAARRALQQALRLAAGGRYMRTFLEEGPELQSLLHEEHSVSCSPMSNAHDEKHLGSRQFLRSLLQACNTDSITAIARTNPSRQSLTTREKSILLFLADGVSNHDIAERIFVSQNTVKFHLKNIYSKLGVKNRIQAISSARSLGLIG
jgi:LuxR family maltose regulon positive regulatory protein